MCHAAGLGEEACKFAVKVWNAQQAGAQAVMICFTAVFMLVCLLFFLHFLHFGSASGAGSFLAWFFVHSMANTCCR